MGIGVLINPKCPQNDKDTMKIDENQLYTPKEVQAYLKVSPSTMIRLIKKGLILAARVGKQYRIRGAELLIFLTPELASKVRYKYRRAREWVHDKTPGSTGD